MDELDKKEKTNKPLAILLFLLISIGLVSTISTLLFNRTNTVINEGLDLIIYVLIVLYFVKFYKKAHSNSLRYILILYFVVTAYNGLSYKPISNVLCYSLIVVALIIAFVAGRLNKFNQNRWILLFGFLLLLFGTIYGVNEIPSELVSSYSTIEEFAYRLSFFNPILQYTCLSLSYLSRSYYHLKAGRAADTENEIL